MVTVKFMSDMYVYSPTGKKTVEVPNPGNNLWEIINYLKLTGREIGLIIIDGEVQSLSKGLEIPVEDGAVIEIYPFIGGG